MNRLYSDDSASLPAAYQSPLAAEPRSLPTYGLETLPNHGLPVLSETGQPWTTGYILEPTWGIQSHSISRSWETEYWQKLVWKFEKGYLFDRDSLDIYFN